jgi:hypothetical protein
MILPPPTAVTLGAADAPTVAAIETRGIVIYIEPDEPREQLLRRMERWMATGFNFLVLKVLVGGRVVWPLAADSEVHGAARRSRRRRNADDPIATLLEVAGMFGVPVYAGFELFEQRERRGIPNDLYRAHRDWFVPSGWQAGQELARRELSRHPLAEEITSIRWLCPSHPDARRFLGDLVVEAVESYPFDGIHFDHLAFPAAAEPRAADFFPSRDLLDGWVEAMDIGRRADAINVSPSDWNEWVGNTVIATINYLRARVYKSRAHLTMMAEVHGSPPDADATPPTYDPPVPVGYLEMDWSRALDTVLDMLAPSYSVGRATRLPELERDLAMLGPEAPLIPVLRLVEAEIALEPFAALRETSVFGFLIDAGRPLLESHWRVLGDVLGDRAVCAHNDPQAALAALQRHTLELLPPKHDLAELLRAMDHLMRSADATQVERTRTNLLKNLKGLIQEGNRTKLKLPAGLESRVLRNLGLMIRLHAVLGSRGQMLKATPYHLS